MPIGPSLGVMPPKAGAPLHSLLGSANRVSDIDPHWEVGLAFIPENCGDANCWAPCPPRDPNCVPLPIKEECDDCVLVEIDYMPYEIYAVQTCTSFSSVDVDATSNNIDTTHSFFKRKAVEFLNLAQSKAIEQEFWSGTCVPTNQHLNEAINRPANTGAVVLASPDPDDPLLAVAQSPSLGLANLVQYLASCGPGGRGMIHAVPLLVERWAQFGFILPVKMSDGREVLMTRSRGHIVVSGGGYDGTGPGGIVPPANQAWAYATRMVDIRMSDIFVNPDNVSEALDRKINQITFRAERTVAAVHDNCCLGAVLVDICAPIL